MPEEKAPEGVDEKLWKANKDLQKQMREQIEAEQAEQTAAAQEAAGKPQTTTTMPSQTVEEAGAENERRAKSQGLPPLAEANERAANKPAPKK